MENITVKYGGSIIGLMLSEEFMVIFIDLYFRNKMVIISEFG